MLKSCSAHILPSANIICHITFSLYAYDKFIHSNGKLLKLNIDSFKDLLIEFYELSFHEMVIFDGYFSSIKRPFRAVLCPFFITLSENNGPFCPHARLFIIQSYLSYYGILEQKTDYFTNYWGNRWLIYLRKGLFLVGVGESEFHVDFEL